MQSMNIAFCRQFEAFIWPFLPKELLDMGNSITLFGGVTKYNSRSGHHAPGALSLYQPALSLSKLPVSSSAMP